MWRAHRSVAGLVVVGFVLAAGPGALAQAAPGTLAGQLLVATPEMPDPRFRRTVIYLLQHDANGAIGLTVNRRVSEATVATLLEHLGLDATGITGTIGVHWGGPVDPSQGFVLHTRDYAGDDTRAVDDAFAVTASPEVLRAIGTGQGPRRALFALGFAGWAPGQLEAEIERGGWITVPADETILFGPGDTSTKWERARARQRIDL